ncbi:hypothetical protein SCLCIDRAFT_1225253, partial [Scleroderma citrinum Foug A]
HTISSSLGGSTSSPPWFPTSSRMHSFNTSSRTITGGLPSSVPTRSPSFPNQQTIFFSALRGSRFVSTFEDDDNHYDSSSGNGNSYAGNRQTIDPSNMSPFVRDVSQILLDDGLALRELRAGMHPRLKMAAQRRPAVVGLNAPGHDAQDESACPSVFHAPSYCDGGLWLSDDDLAGDLGVVSLSKDGPGPSTSPTHPPSHLRTHVSEPVFPYQPINLNIPSDTSFTSSQRFGSPSGLSAGTSPPRSQLEQQLIDVQCRTGGNNGHGSHQQQQQSLTARGSGLSSPLSPTTGRPIQPQQGPYYPQQMQRRTSDAPMPNLNELGKGVPLSSVPASWPLYIVEFKAGCTDLFYLTDLTLDIRVGDLVIVEADRGKDLGTVVNDTITLKEVEAFEREQRERVAYGDGGPLSPGGQQGGGSKKEIKALQLCQNKARQKKLPMEVIDAEYQWDRRKLTFCFVAEKRINFRELVRELLRLYKTRIWMASLQGPSGYEQ